ncbi:MAG: hypothetical protein JO128_20830 [Alphaproteobacteria bacterium]|nr:hypothetical protein [Alphaproteobacteria bacterium]
MADRQDDWEDDIRDSAPGSEEHHLIRDFVGLVCLLAAFLIFVVVMAPAVAPLLLRVL